MALKELQELLQDESAYLNIETNNEMASVGQKVTKKKGRPSVSHISEDKFTIGTKMMTLDEIKKQATKEPSDKQLKVISDRAEKSQFLLESIKSKECQVI